MRPRVPKGLTPVKLRWIATYIDECDSLVAQALARLDDPAALDAAQKLTMPYPPIQTDLRRWADEIEHS